MEHWEPIYRVTTLRALWSKASGIQNTGGLEYSCRLHKTHIHTETHTPWGKPEGWEVNNMACIVCPWAITSYISLNRFALFSFSLLPNLFRWTSAFHPLVFSLPYPGSLWSMLSAGCIPQSSEICLRLTSLLLSTSPVIFGVYHKLWFTQLNYSFEASGFICVSVWICIFFVCVCVFTVFITVT